MRPTSQDGLFPQRKLYDVTDIIYAMRKQEEAIYWVKDYMPKPAGLFSTGDRVDANCRRKMCEWCYQISEACEFHRDTVSVAMNYLDRFASSTEGRSILRDRNEFQLAAITSFYLAIKMSEPVRMDIALFVELSRGYYKEKDIAGMERRILTGLQWRVQGPTPLSFVQHFLALLPESVDRTVVHGVMESSKYQTELAAADYDLVRENPSEVAIAAILNAFDGLDSDTLSRKNRQVFIETVEFFAGISCEQVDAICQFLKYLVLEKHGVSVKDMVAGTIDDGYEESSVESLESKENCGLEGIIADGSSPVCVSRG